MKYNISDRLSGIDPDNITIMIIGLGSVGSYLLDYLVSRDDPSIRIVVAGRNRAKLEESVNIIRVSALIRGQNRSHIDIADGVDLDQIDTIEAVIRDYHPDIIVNSSRAYPGLKYGTISWSNIRAYGLWTPLAIKYIRNIMEAHERAASRAIVINTSYSDAVIPWLKSAGHSYPDFGSGNLNHLIPRIRYAVAEILGADDFWNVDVCFAAGHFHDVCISKEGQTEGVTLPLKVYYHGQEQSIDDAGIYRRCAIAMPTDARRNMMNASSNYRIIDAIITSLRHGGEQRVFSPGFDARLGGYPVIIGHGDAVIDTSVFTLEEMTEANRLSMALDGIEDVDDGNLIYTDQLLEKVRKAFGVELPKVVGFEAIDSTAEFIISKIIQPRTEAK